MPGRSDEEAHEMLLTQLEYFVALAKEQHFGRAAAAAYVSPSALSESIRKLEAQLGVPLVRRGRSFDGLTPDGELVLKWAQRMLSDHRALTDELTVARGRLATRGRFGVIPSAVSAAAEILSTLAVAHPQSRMRMSTGLTSEQIITGIRHYEYDAGLIHPAAADRNDLLTTTLYEEHAVVIINDQLDPGQGGTISAGELVDLPLGLLEPHMRARQILDDALEAQGLNLTPRIESDSVEGLLALVRRGPWAVVVPASAAPAHEQATGVHQAELREPRIVFPIALARLADQPASSLVAAIEAAAL